MPERSSPPVSRLPTLDDLDPAGKRILVRVDFNVPLAGGRVADDTRLRGALPTITELLDRGASLVLVSHLGRPKGVDEALRMKPVGEALAALLGRPVRTLDQVVGPAVEGVCRAMRPGEVVLLENVRFEKGEKASDPEFTAALARLADVYVNDAFGTAHRAEASTVAVAYLLPAYAGRLLQKELDILGGALAAPARPFAVVLGGAKVSDKLAVIDALLPKADVLLIGGGMANTFLAAAGTPMGDSLVEQGQLDTARRIRQAAGDKLVLPTDLVIADAFAADAETRTVDVSDGVPAGWRALDIGPRSIVHFDGHLDGARTVVWNGPMGVFEMPLFAAGTFGLARAIAALGGGQPGGATTIIGGGDSAAAIEAAGLADHVTWVSTGGGAALEFLEGKTLPAVAALMGRRET